MAQSQTERSGQPLLSVRGICKVFSLNRVFKGIDLDIHPGEILVLIGGNGTGKSISMKIIMGIYQPDQGEAETWGEKVSLTKPPAALTCGIYMVPQEPMLFPNMTVEENTLVGVGLSASGAELRRRLTQLMDDIDWHLDLIRKANSFSIAGQQLVEILRGLLRNAEPLIFDELTSAPTFDEVESLFRCIRGLQKKGIGMIYITHRLTEVFDIAIHVVIMRDGVIMLHRPIGDFTREILVKGLLPPSMQDQEIKGTTGTAVADYEDAEPIFELQNYSDYGFRGINLKIYPGETLGAAGVAGVGRIELATTIFDKDKVLGGKATLDDRDITGLSTKKVLEAGVNYVPEDWHLDGLFKTSDVAANIASAILNRMVMGKVFLNRKAEYDLTQKYVEHSRVKVTRQDQLTGSLSGSDQQKVVIVRAPPIGPKLAILDESTRGIDAVARGEVYPIIHQLKEQGVVVMLTSSDMEKIVELSDCAAAVYQGRISGEFQKEEVSQDNLMAAVFNAISREQVVSRRC